jgi:putative membrane protein insertion efficiency factor
VAVVRRVRRLLGAGLLCALFLLTDLPLRSEVGAIRLYQSWVSPVLSLAVRCRFEETCSVYALRQLEERGFWGGNLLTAGRLLMCSPLGALVDAVRPEPPTDQ